MAFALVGLATGLGARYPRFAADNPSQVAGSYGGVAFMILAVLFIIVMIVLLGWPSSVLLWHRAAHIPLTARRSAAMAACFGGAVAMSLATWWFGMRSGVRALDAMGGKRADEFQNASTGGTGDQETEDRGSRVEDRAPNHDPRSSILDPRFSVLDPRSSPLDVSKDFLLSFWPSCRNVSCGMYREYQAVEGASS